jgi:hypothetical protein
MFAVFYSWQTDTPAREGRSFIENALREAVKRLRADLTVEDALRGNIAVDKDTQGVPGSPPIFDTILQKIEKAGAFVADVTSTASGNKGELTANPNVLIEYGFALGSLGHARMIAIVNEAYGKVTEQTVPFDMRHLRWPIKYTLLAGASREEYRTQQKALAGQLEIALRSVFDSHEFKQALDASQRPPEDRPRLGARVVNLLDDGYRAGVAGGALEVEFRLRHLSGRPATTITIDPIWSFGSNFELRMDGIPFLALGQEVILRYEVWRNGQRPPRKLVDAIGWGKLLADFVSDSRSDGNDIGFPLMIWFMDGQNIDKQEFRLIYDSSSRRFNVMDAFPVSG